jgi:hypothetical protein
MNSFNDNNSSDRSDLEWQPPAIEEINTVAKAQIIIDAVCTFRLIVFSYISKLVFYYF